MRKNNLHITYLIILPITLFLGISTTHAECTIKNGPSQKLTEYILSVNKKISELKSASSNPGCGNSKPDVSRVSTSITKVFNKSTGINNFTSSTDFWVQSAINGDFPQEFTRDLILLKKQSDKISGAFDAIGRNCGSLDGITSLMEDHINVIQAYMVITTGGKLNKVTYNDPKNKDELIADLTDSYLRNKQSCISSGKGAETMDKLSTTIGDFGKGFESGYKNWREAWSLLTGQGSKEYEKVEKKLLQKELSKQGLSSERSSALLTCLTASGCKNNAGSANIGYTGLKGYLENIKLRAATVGTAFVDMFSQIDSDLYDALVTPNTNVFVRKLKHYAGAKKIVSSNSAVSLNDDQSSIVEGDYSRQLTKNQNTNGIADDYELAKQLIFADNLELATGVGHAQKIHIIVNKAVEEVRLAAPLATSICQRQVQGMGKCRY